MPTNIENKAMAFRLEMFNIISIPKKGDSKECNNYYTNDPYII